MAGAGGDDGSGSMSPPGDASTLRLCDGGDDTSSSFLGVLVFLALRLAVIQMQLH